MIVGSLVLQKLLQIPESFQAIGLLRTEKSGNKLLSKFFVKKENLVVSDVTNTDALAKAFQGCDKVLFKSMSITKVKKND